MLDNIVSYLVAPHKFVNFNTLLPDEVPINYVRVKFLFCGICGGDYSRYLGYRKEYPLSLGHEFVAQVLEHNCSSAMGIETLLYRTLIIVVWNVAIAKKGKAIYVKKTI